MRFFHFTCFAILVVCSVAHGDGLLQYCAKNFKKYFGEVRETSGLRLLLREVGPEDPITIHEGFFGVHKEPKPDPWFVPKDYLALYNSLPVRGARAVVSSPIHFLAALDGVYHMAVNKPVGWASERLGFARQRTTYLMETAAFGLASYGIAIALNGVYNREFARQVKEKAEELDEAIENDFRMEALRHSLAQKQMSRDDARKIAYLLIEDFKAYYKRTEQGASYKTSENEEFLRRVGVFPYDVDYGSLPRKTQERLLAINHLLMMQYRVIADIKSVDNGKIQVSDAPDLEKVVKEVEGEEGSFSRNLIKLHTEGHRGKRIDLPTLKRFLMQDAWIRAIDNNETVMGRDADEIALKLREQALDDLRKHLK